MTTRAPHPYEPPHEQPGSGARAGGTAGEQPRKRRFRPGALIPLAVAAWALLEIWLLMLVADAAGGFTVFALIVGGFVLGAVAIKRAGRRAWGNLTRNVQRAQQGRAHEGPEEGDAEGRGGNALAMFGGLLLMVPGLVSDAAGLLCLFPPTAGLMRRLTRRYLERRSGFAPGTLGDAYQQARTAEEQIRMHRPDGKVVEGEVIEGRVVRDDDEHPKR